MRKSVNRSWGFVAAMFGLVASLATTFAAETNPSVGPEIVITSNRTNCIYKPGEVIQWRVEVKGAGSNFTAAPYVIKKGSHVRIAEGTVTNGVNEISTTIDGPETVLLEIKVPLENGKKTNYYGGAVVSPEKISPSLPCPEDFDAFWKGKLKALAKVPINPVLVKGESDRAGADYWEINLDGYAGSRVRGQISRPQEKGKYPAMLIVQGAGVYALNKSSVTRPGSKGWIALNISAHDLPIIEPTEFYTAQLAGPLKEYWTMGRDDREKSYFLRMYLACHRAVEYLSKRPDWDGKTLLVTGSSQGGMQALVSAGIHPKVTAAIANVPGGCDLTGTLVGRRSGWPSSFFKNAEQEAVIQTSRYFDVANFARRIKCPVLVGVGLVDEVCPPGGILASVNQVKGKKEIIILSNAGHMGENDSHRPFSERSKVWQAALKEGASAPVAANVQVRR